MFLASGPAKKGGGPFAILSLLSFEDLAQLGGREQISVVFRIELTEVKSFSIPSCAFDVDMNEQRKRCRTTSPRKY